jgi:hypothetical protein
MLARRGESMSISTHFRCELERVVRSVGSLWGWKALIQVGRCTQLAFCSPGGDLSSRSQPQLAKDPGYVITRCALGDRELGGDLAVGETPGDEELPPSRGG